MSVPYPYLSTYISSSNLSISEVNTNKLFECLSRIEGHIEVLMDHLQIKTKQETTNGKDAYEAYIKTIGNPAKNWEELPEIIKAGWISAGNL